MDSDFGTGNNLFEITFSSTHGGITGLLNKTTGDNYVKKKAAGLNMPFALFYLDHHCRKRRLVPRVLSGCESTEDGRVISLKFQSMVNEEGQEWAVQAEMTVFCFPDDAESIWRLSIKNHTENLKIVEVLFPYISGIWIGDTHQDDFLVYPHHAGEKIQNPAENYASQRYLQFDRAGSKREGSYYSREINYCGLASMMWMDYYDDSDGGLYLASYDDDYLLTGVRVEVGGPADPWVGFSFRKYLPIEPGTAWTSKPYSVGIHRGDWHWGADRYRAWFNKGRVYPEFAEDLLTQSVLCPRYDFRRNEGIFHKFKEIPAMYDEARADGINHFLIAGWNRQGFDSNYPEYFPDMELGSPLDLARGVEYINAHGGMVTFYVNVRIFDIHSDYFPTLGTEWALKDEQGKWIKETYGPPSFAVMCPKDKAWQQRVVDYATVLVKWYGAKGIYLDQLGSATPYPCYDQAHNHEHHGLFNQGYLEMIRGILEAADPDSPPFLMIENCGDIYGEYIFANLTWNGTFYDEFFNLYKYTFPHYIQINMVNPRRIPERRLRHQWFYRDVERAMLLGSILWVELGERFVAEDDCLRSYLRNVIKMRQACAYYFAHCTFRDDLEIRYDPRIRMTHWSGEVEGKRIDLIIAGRGMEVTDAGSSVAIQDELNVLLELSPERVERVEFITPGREFAESKFMKTHAGIEIPLPVASLLGVKVTSR
ncbi:MAG TPA: DUF6259 domain-containing protein [Bacillota bacterium]